MAFDLVERAAKEVAERAVKRDKAREEIEARKTEVRASMVGIVDADIEVFGVAVVAEYQVGMYLLYLQVVDSFGIPRLSPVYQTFVCTSPLLQLLLPHV